MNEQTLSILKPDVVSQNQIGAVITELEKADLNIVAMRLCTLSQTEAEHFYDEHSQRPFYAELVEFMTSGPVVLMILEGENAIYRNREVMGATNPADAEEGTIRNKFGKGLSRNAIHGSDSPKSAKREIALMFGSERVHDGSRVNAA